MTDTSGHLAPAGWAFPPRSAYPLTSKFAIARVSGDRRGGARRVRGIIRPTRCQDRKGARLPIPVTEVDVLQDFLYEMIHNRADHHKPEIRHTALAVAGALVVFKDPGTPIEVKEVQTAEGPRWGRQLWFSLGGVPCTLTYDRERVQILLRRRHSPKGELFRFQPGSPVSEAYEVFHTLHEVPWG